MIYTKAEVKRNVMAMSITSILVGFFLGFSNLSTTMQVLFNKVGGESLLTTINQINYYTLILCLLVIGLSINKINLKYKIILLDMITYISYLVIGLLLFFNKLSGITLFCLMLISMVCARILTVLKLSFRMKIMPNNEFKNFLGKMTFLQTVATILGMLTSYLVIKITYPNNFIIIMISGFFIGVLVNTIYSLIIEKTEVQENEGKHGRASFEKVIKVLKEKNFILMIIGKTILNFAYGVSILYSMYAMRIGYNPSDIVLFGVALSITTAIFNIIVPKIKISSKQSMIIGHLILGIGALTTYLTKNFYIGFALWGMSDAFVNIGYYGYINSLGDERKHIYLTGQTTFNISMGLSIPFASFMLNKYGFEILCIISFIIAVVSIAFIKIMDENENEVDKIVEIKRDLEMDEEEIYTEVNK